MVYGKLCGIKSQTIPSPERSGVLHVTLDMQGDGRIDPRTPDKLSGSTRETEGRTTHTLTWTCSATSRLR